MRKSILLLVLPVSIFAFWGIYCFPYSCNPSISYAMGKQRDAINKRLNDVKNTIHALKVETDRQTLYLTKESVEMIRLRARIKIETYLLMKNNHLIEKTDY